MSRRPFDPSLARGGLFGPPSDAAPRAGGGPGGEVPPLSVTQATDRIKRAVEGIGQVRVVGEVSNFSSPKHWYFTIKDAESQLGCVMWSSRAASAGFVPGNGTEVVVTGTLTHYGKGGRTQLDVQRIERRGAGSLQQRYEELRRLLESEGYFARARKRPLPTFPRCVAVITSFQADALQDVLKTAKLRAPFVRILVVGVPVQGESAAPAVARAISAVDRRADELGLDAMIVTRGGGSSEDLWAFNERVVADAVFRSATPVVAAIGHESDTTIIDWVADHRASTPTQAVMELFPDAAAESEMLDALTDRLARVVRRQVVDAQRQLAVLARHPLFRSPRAPIDLRRAELERLRARLSHAVRARESAAARRLADARARFERHRPSVRQAAARERLRALAQRLDRAARVMVTDLRGQLGAAERQLRALGPGQVLARGYSLTFGPDGRLVRAVTDAPAGTSLATRVSDGTIHSTVGDAPAPTLFDSRQ